MAAKEQRIGQIDERAAADIRQFALVVKEMRHAQKLYFKKRHEALLIVSKELERKVDELTHVIIEGREISLI